MNKLHTAMAGLIALSILVSGCSSLPGSGTSLDGTAWVLTHIGTTPVLIGSQPTLRFESGQVSGFGSCNGFGGEYQQSGNEVTFTGIMSTLMACDPIEITQQETAYFSALASAAEFQNRAWQIENIQLGRFSPVNLLPPGRNPGREDLVDDILL